MNMNNYLKKNMTNVVLLAVAALFFWPMLWLVFSSFDADANFAIKIPTTWTLGNYGAVLGKDGNLQSFLNSFIIASLSAVIVTVLALIAAYPLSRYNLKNKKKIMYSILFLTGLPITAIMVPVYMVFFKLKISNSLISTSLFLAATALPYSIWMMKNYMDAVPVVLEECAWLEGAGILQTIRYVISPIILPGIFVVFIFVFSGSWGNFFVPYILISSVDKIPASVSIYQFFGSFNQVNYGHLAAFSVLYTLPIAALYLVTKRFTSSGYVLNGAVK
jgi:ABC-type sugar transport system, permease component